MQSSVLRFCSLSLERKVNTRKNSAIYRNSQSKSDRLEAAELSDSCCISRRSFLQPSVFFAAQNFLKTSMGRRASGLRSRVCKSALLLPDLDLQYHRTTQIVRMTRRLRLSLFNVSSCIVEIFVKKYSGNSRFREKSTGSSSLKEDTIPRVTSEW